jgi:hypothetical protein
MRGTVGGDSLREIRSMTIMSLPFPPLPIMVTKQMCDEESCTDGSYHVANSHDLIAHFLNIKSVSNDEQDSFNRQSLQKTALVTLCTSFDNWKSENKDTTRLPSADICLLYFGAFLRSYIQSFIGNKDCMPDIRIMPINTMYGNHPVYLQSIQFVNAQNILYGICGGEPTSDITTYVDILQMSANRIISSS